MNLADLLTKKHELTIGDLSVGSDWHAKDIPFSPYQSLTITKEVEELIEEECFKDVTLLSELLTL